MVGADGRTGASASPCSEGDALPIPSVIGDQSARKWVYCIRS